ncbi:MAG: TonB-dependent receptor [Bacteroidia bacterium]|nr:TonB-dependent receptor [Bacteroidia bacterium]
MHINAQSFIYGRTLASQNEAIPYVKVINLTSGDTTNSDSLGNYKIKYAKGKRNSLRFEMEFYSVLIKTIPELFSDEDLLMDVILKSDITDMKGFKLVKSEPFRQTNIIVKPLSTRPSFGDFNDIIKSFAGVSSNNELSSQYNVRGGSYDENLIYVNDFEVYRPQLVRSGQQEGLSFVNPDMVNNLVFSAGGFEAKYGDKLSSVLDVNYRSPVRNSSGFQIGMLGSSFFVDGVLKAKRNIGSRDSIRFSYIIGGRYRGNKNVLTSLDAQGIYKSRFGDLQSLMTLHINRFNRIEFLVNYAQNRFRFEPEYQETTFGTLQSALKLKIGMDGQEIVDYHSVMGGLAFIRKTSFGEFKFMASGVNSTESEHYDIEGKYEISEIDNNLGSSSFGDSKLLLGYGYFINHARNDLKFNIVSFAHQGTVFLRGFKNKNKDMSVGYLRHPSRLIYGFKYQIEQINDVFKEWKYSDSSDYNVSYQSGGDSLIYLFEGVRSKSAIYNQRYSGFAQYHQAFGGVNQLTIVSGVRYLYSSLNQQALVSPRFQLYFEPNKHYNYSHRNDTLPMKKNVLLKAAFGYYYQAPFYREMRDFVGNVNTALKAQRSIHYTTGVDFNFKKFGRPFKFSGEMFYKNLDYLVPYILDNVRIRYYATNSARGYAGGFDMRVNGEFIKDIESWFSLSFLKTDEKITYISSDSAQVESEFLRRPTDRRVSAAIMFQDELKTNKDYRMHLMLNFASGLPYYLGGSARYKEGNTIPAYKRVDIGFSKVLVNGAKTKLKSKNIESMWLGIDVFNLLQINNVISYLWVKDFNNTTYGVPNYLTGRRINVRLVAKF